MILAELTEEHPDKVTIREYEWRYKDLIQSIPGAKFRDGVFLLPLTWPTSLAMMSNLDVYGVELVWSDELKAYFNDLFVNKIQPAYNLHKALSVEEGYDFLYPHQKADVAFMSTAKKGILAMPLGSGKSISAAASLRNMHENQGEEVFPCLVVCPNSTKIGWEREFEKAWPGRKITVIDGTAAQRKKQFKQFNEEGGEVLIINWDLLRNHSKLKAYGGTALKRCVECGGLDEKVKATTCQAHEKELNKIEFNSVIADELHRQSDPKSQTSRALKAAAPEAEIKIGLTGTPINSEPSQIFSALNWLYPSSYQSRVKFLDRFFDVAQSYWGGTEILGVKKSMEQEFFQGIDPILRSLPKEAILPFLPPVVRVVRETEMGTKQAKAYKQMAENMIAELGDDITVASSPLVQMTRLVQLASAYGEVKYKDVYDANSPIPGVPVQEEYVELSDPSCKVDAFMEDIPEFGDSSVVVFGGSKQLINLLAKRMDKNDIKYGLITGDQDIQERQAYMDAFQSGNIQFILCTIQAAGTGITLTRADTMVFLNRSYSMIDNVQAEGRSHRIGSEIHDKIKIIDYVTKGTADELIVDAIDKKKDNLEFLLRNKQVIANTIEGKDTND